ncbi:MAG: helix-turn-helix transcriptional regulator [Lapillicoccus sp.]
MRRVNEPPAASFPHDLRVLTPREREIVILLIAAGPLTNTQIATRLGVSERTVKGHFTCILAKLHRTGRDEIWRPVPSTSPPSS